MRHEHVLPPGYAFCPECPRHSPGDSFPLRLVEQDLPQLELIFKVVECGAYVFSEKLVATARSLGLSGLQPGANLKPVPVVGS